MNYFHRWTLRLLAAAVLMAVVFTVLGLIELVRWIVGVFG